MHINYLSFLEEYLGDRQHLLSALQKKSRGISLLRVCLFVLAAIFVYLYLSYRIEYWLFAGIGIFMLFVVLVKISAGLKARIKDCNDIIEIISSEIDYNRSEFGKFETGEEFTDHNHAFSTDLDIFGNDSLFHRLSRSADKGYKQQLSLFLSVLPTHADITLERQKIIRDLAQRRKFRLEARVLLNRNDGRDKERLKLWMNTGGFFNTLPWEAARIFLLILSVSGIAATFYYGSIHPLLSLSVIVNVAVLGLISRKVNYYHNLVSLPGEGIKAFVELSKKIGAEKFNAPYLLALQQKADKALHGLEKLKSLTGLLDQRLNGFLGVLLNILFVYDLWIIRRLESWKRHSGKEAEAFLEETDTFRIYETLSNYTAHHENFVFPEFSEEKPLKLYRMSHPFLAGEKVVKNDFEIREGDNLFLVTGANMAGKSTFLRAVGLNWVTGMIGLPVCAEAAQMKHVDLMTSMRINDSLSGGTSYFKAEVERLRKLMDLVGSSRSSIVLLDEILRGTNSNDKRTGTIGFCEKLLRLNGKGVIATHDLEVAGYFEGVKGIRNINFESFIREGQLIFDYTLRTGIAENTNASAIMKERGIID